MKSAGQLLLYALVIYTSLMGLGLGMIRLIRTGRSRESDAITYSPVLAGLAVVHIAGWYVLQFTDVGVDGSYRVLLFGSLAAFASFFVEHRTSLRSAVQRLVSEHWVAFASMLLFAISWWPLLRHGFLTSASNNGDVASYAQAAQHVQHRGFDNVGRIVGGDMGHVARVDASGAYMVLAYAKGIIGRPYNQIMLPVLATFIAIMAQQGRVILSRSLRMSPGIAAIIALFVQTTFMTAYLTVNYFLAQFMSMAAFFGFIIVCLWLRQAVEHARRLRIRELVLASGPAVVLLVTYPHMAFVVAPTAVICIAPYRDFVRLRAYVWGAVGIAVVTGVLCMQKVLVGVDRFFALAKDTANGWPLPSLSPAELLGFQTNEYSSNTASDRVLSALIVVVVTGSLWLRRRRRSDGSTQGLLPLFVVIASTCVYMFLSAPGTYRNWKWTTYFTPLLVIVCLWAIVSVINRSTVFYRVCAIGLVVLGALNMSRTHNLMEATASRSAVVSYELSQVASAPALRGVDEVNVKSGDFLLSMWPALFLEPKKVHILDLSYYTAPAPIAGPTIVKIDDRFTSSRLQPLGGGYGLIDYPKGGVTTSTDSFGSQVSVGKSPASLIRGESREMIVSLRNTGASTWLGSGGWLGSVNVGARLLDARTREPIEEIGRDSIAPFPDYVMPGEMRKVKIVVTTSVEPGEYLLEVGPLIEQISWASELSPDFVSVTPLVVR